MPFALVRNDITKMRVDAIVASARPSLLGGGGADGAIRRAAGPKLALECLTLGGCRVGESKLTKGYRLPCKYVIHTVAPRWMGGGKGEAELLKACYRSALELAVAHGCESVAIPLLGSGARGFPKAQAVQIAMQAIIAFLEDHDLLIDLVVFDRESLEAGSRLSKEIRQYIDDAYVAAHDEPNARLRERRQDEVEYDRRLAEAGDASRQPSEAVPPLADAFELNRDAELDEGPSLGQSLDSVAGPEEVRTADAAPPPKIRLLRRSESVRSTETPSRPPRVLQARRSSLSMQTMGDMDDLEKLLARLDESFAQMLFRKIDERGISDAQCYKRANIDRRLFSKIRSDPGYKPSKPTVVALAVALELPLEEAKDLIGKAGYSLSHSSKFDIIVEFCIRHHMYDIFEINNVLFEYDMPLLGAF